MTKYALRDFEYQIGAVTRNAATALVLDGRVVAMQEIEKHYWVAKVSDGETVWESEIMITPARIKAYSCTCWSGPRRFMCIHIAATLLQVRKFLQQKAEEKSKEKAGHPTGFPRMTTAKILERVAPEQLLAFVQAYASRDPDFALALKTRFADANTEDINPWLGLLEKQLRHQTYPLKPAVWKRLRHLIGDMQARLKIAEENGDLPVRYQVNMALLTALGPVAEEAASGSFMTEVCREAITRLEHVVTHPFISPEWRLKITDTLIRGAVEWKFSPTVETQAALWLGRHFAKDQWAYKQLEARFEQPETIPSALSWQVLVLALAQKKSPNDAVKTIIARCFPLPEGPRVTTIVAEILQKATYYPAASELLEAAQAHWEYPPDQRRQIHRRLMVLAQLAGDTNRQIELLSADVLQYGHTEVLPEIKALSGDQWPDRMRWFVARATEGKQTDLIAQLLVFDGQIAVLQAWLEQQEDADLLLTHAAHLPDDALTELLFRLFSRHLETHFGRPAAVHLRDKLSVLLSAGRRQVVVALIRRIEQAFSDRTGLGDTLREIFDLSSFIRLF